MSFVIDSVVTFRFFFRGYSRTWALLPHGEPYTLNKSNVFQFYDKT